MLLIWGGQHGFDPYQQSTKFHSLKFHNRKEVITMPSLVSPNDLLMAARNAMLEGEAPSTYEDWFKIFNFLAANIAPQAQPAVLILISKIYDVPLGEKEIRAISAFQTSRQTD
jgi:hypothetical protein